MPFFQDLRAMGTAMQWTFVIVVSDDGKFNVLVDQIPTDLKNNTGARLAARRFVATAEEFDANFFSQLRPTTAHALEFFQNLREFEKSIHTKKTELQNKTKTPAPQPSPKAPEKDPKQKQFDAIMKKVKDLEDAGKIGQAIGALPKIADFKSFETTILARTNELKKKHGGFTLFFEEPESSALPTTKPETTPPTDPDPDEHADPDAETADPQNNVDPDAELGDPDTEVTHNESPKKKTNRPNAGRKSKTLQS